MIKDKIEYCLKQLKRLWMFFSKVLVKVNTVILLSLVYIFIVGIVALIARLFRKDFLQKKIDPHRVSYWQIRISSEPSLDRNKYQF